MLIKNIKNTSMFEGIKILGKLRFDDTGHMTWQVYKEWRNGWLAIGHIKKVSRESQGWLFMRACDIFGLNPNDYRRK
jgi:hypothetical protein